MRLSVVNDLIPKSGESVYTLIQMAILRSWELSAGRPPLIEDPVSDKIPVIALEEIAQGKINMESHARVKAKKNIRS